MDINEYQKRAYSTAVFGGEFNYPIAALAEEVGEVCMVWSDWVHNAEYLKTNWNDVQAKLLDEMGDVLWNLAAICTLIDIPLSEIEKYAATTHTNSSVAISYYVCRLAGTAGKLNGIWAKYIRKHNGAEPKVKVIANLEPYDNVTNLRGQIMSQCIIILHVLHSLAVRLEIDFNEMMIHNIEKLAARKKANTIDGVGSVERK